MSGTVLEAVHLAQVRHGPFLQGACCSRGKQMIKEISHTHVNSDSQVPSGMPLPPSNTWCSPLHMSTYLTSSVCLWKPLLGLTIFHASE